MDKSSQFYLFEVHSKKNLSKKKEALDIKIQKKHLPTSDYATSFDVAGGGNQGKDEQSP